ncbi:MAG: hypothetical protein KIT33_08340 [Candidatus Kapabacteria bacterium]|nr:hypothetical protein [Ignavibacteriota bacterium]MCW5884963.1 hypothetical protein [Candidatus Kapabacteria bacterium]
MSKTLIIISTILLISTMHLAGAAEKYSIQFTKTNYEIYDSMAVDFAEKIFENYIKQNYKEINYEINNIEASGLIEKALVDICLNNNIEIISDTLQHLSHIIKINRFETKYYEIQSSKDSLHRKIEFDAILYGDFKGVRTFHLENSDIVSREDVPLLESRSATYVNSAVPPRKKTFYEKALEPAILVSAAILSVIILFTVRSN